MRKTDLAFIVLPVALVACKRAAQTPRVRDDAAPALAAPVGAQPVPPEVGPIDSTGDLLPAGAVARLGSLRFLDRDLADMVFVGDGKELVSSGVKGYTIWDATTGRRLADLRQDDPSPVLGASPDGKLLATGVAGRGKAQLWDLLGRKTLGEVVLGREIEGLCFTDDTTLVTGADGLIATWRPGGDLVRRVEIAGGHLSALGCAAGQVAMGDDSGRVSSLTLAGNAAPVVLGTTGMRITAIAINPAGSQVAASSIDGNIYVWPTATPGPPTVIQAHDRLVASLGWSGDALWSAGGDAWIRSWQADGTLLKEHEAIAGLSVQRLALSRDGRRAATWSSHRGPKGSEAGRFWLWDLATGDASAEPERHTASLTSIAFAPDGAHVATASEDSSVRIWEVPRGAPAAVLTAPEGVINAVRFAAGGRMLFAGGADAYIYAWDWKADRVEKTVGPIGGEVNGFALTEGESRMVTGDEIGRVWSWDVAARARLQAHDRRAFASITGVAVAADGRMMAITGSDRVILIVDLRSGAEITRLVTDAISSYAAAFTPDSKLLATASDDGRIRLWATDSWAEVRAIEGHDGSVRCLAFSPDGTRLVSGGSDAAVRVWQVADGKQVASFEGHRGAVTGVAFSADGKLAGSASHDRTGMIWKIP